MNKKGIIFFSSLLLLAGCGDKNTTDSDPEEPVVEGTEEKTEIFETESPSHTYNDLVNETTFTEEYGLQAWEDYKKIIDDVDLGKINLINEDNPNFD